MGCRIITAAIAVAALIAMPLGITPASAETTVLGTFDIDHGNLYNMTWVSKPY
jgi:hypothetical protein